MSHKTELPLAKLLELNGFTLKRQKKHLIFSSESGHNFVIAATPSCSHAEKNNRSELKKLCLRLGREFIDSEDYEEPKQKGTDMHALNTKLIRNGEPVRQETANPGGPKPRQMDDEGLRIMVEGRQNGWTLERICDALNALGYVSARGLPISGPYLSTTLIKLGHRKAEGHAIQRVSKTRKPSMKQTASFMQNLTEVITSNLQDDMKEKFVMQMLRDKMGL